MELFARDRQFWRTTLSAAIVGTLGAAGALLFTTVVRLGTDALWPEEIDYDLLGGAWWWIAITTGAGLLVGVLRRALRVPEEPSASLAMIQDAKTDYRTALQTIVVSAISLIGGASLGPFDAGTRSGGAIGAWFSDRRQVDDDEREVNTLSGIGGALGGLLTAPFLATLLVTELRRPDASRYYRVLIPNLTGAVFGFVVFFTVAGDTFLGVFSVPGYDVQPWHFGAAVGLGIIA
ncbi:MAG: chloride channel protein, partial [Acidimicrobiales bacterium]